MNISLDANLTHVLQLAVIGAVIVLLVIYGHGTIDAQSLLLGFIGAVGPLAGFHLASNNNSNTSSPAQTVPSSQTLPSA